MYGLPHLVRYEIESQSSVFVSCVGCWIVVPGLSGAAFGFQFQAFSMASALPASRLFQLPSCVSFPRLAVSTLNLSCHLLTVALAQYEAQPDTVKSDAVNEVITDQVLSLFNLIALPKFQDCCRIFS